MKNISIFITVMVLLMISVNISCTKEDGLFDNPEDEQVPGVVNTEKVSVKNGVLVFQTRTDLYDYLNEVADDHKLEQKERELGFKSLFTICLPSSIEDEKLWESYKNLDYTETEFLEAIESGALAEYSEATLDLIKQGKMKFEKGGEYEVLAYTSCAPYLVKVLNENNLLCINDSIFQYNEHEIKFIPDGNFDLIKELDNITGDEDYKGIIVAKERREKDYYYPTNYVIWPNPPAIDQSGTSWNSKMIEGTLRIRHFDYLASNEGNAPWYYASFYIQAYTWSHRFWAWRYDSDRIYLSSFSWYRDYTWMGSNGRDFYNPVSGQLSTNGSSGGTYLMYEGWSNPAHLYNIWFWANVVLQRDDNPDVSVHLTGNAHEVPSRWW